MNIEIVTKKAITKSVKKINAIKNNEIGGGSTYWIYKDTSEENTYFIMDYSFLKILNYNWKNKDKFIIGYNQKYNTFRKFLDVESIEKYNQRHDIKLSLCQDEEIINQCKEDIINPDVVKHIYKITNIPQLHIVDWDRFIINELIKNKFLAWEDNVCYIERIFNVFYKKIGFWDDNWGYKELWERNIR